MSGERPVVLFLCMHNAGRSQMAAAFARAFAGGRAVVLSGGSAPAEEANPAAVTAMAEIGINLTGASPRSFTESDLAEATVIVTMGCGEECPYVPGKRYLDWEVQDPAGQPLAVVRAIRDEIADRVRDLLEELGIGVE